MNVGAITLLDQSRQSSRIHIGIIFLLLQSKIEHLALEFDRALAARLSGKKGSEPKLAESLLNLIEAFPTEAELTTRLRNRIAIDRMSAQHFVFDLSAIARIEEIHLEEIRSNVFRAQVQRARSKQGLLFGGSHHENTNYHACT